MTLYLDSSALIKRYMPEPGSDVLRPAMRDADAWATARIGHVETLGTIGRRYGIDSEPARRFRDDWPAIDVIEVGEELVELAVELMVVERLRSLDAIHLAAALDLGATRTTFATWDKRLWQAAQRRGLELLPEAR